MAPSASLPPFSRGVPKMLAALRPSARAGDADTFVVCGANALTYRLVEELVQRYGAQVTVVMTPAQKRTGRDFSDLAGVRVVTADRLDDRAFISAGIRDAAGLALTEQDDVGNIHAAMRAEEINGRLRIVIRMFNLSLGLRVRQLFRDCAIISDSAIAAPAFVQAALGDGAPTYFRLSGRTLYAASRADVAPGDVICDLSRTGPDGAPDVLPDIDVPGPTDVVLAVAHGERQTNGHGRGKPKRKTRPWSVGPLVRNLRQSVSRSLRIALAVTFGVLLAGGVSLAVSSDEGVWVGIYKTLLTAFSGADASDSTAVQISQLVVTVAGMALVPLLTATVVEGLVNTRLAVSSGRLLTPRENHVVVVGLGNVGTRVIRSLHDLGVSVVAIDKNADARGVALARELDIPLIIGDASREETLRTASVTTCSALVIVSTDDVVNLEAALGGRALRPGLKIVVRLFDTDFAERLQRTFSIGTSRSVSALAAPAFAASLLEREVLATIPIGRRVLLVAELPIAPRSRLDGRTIGEIGSDGEARVIALTAAPGRLSAEPPGARSGEPRPIWSPPAARRLEPFDRLTVIATRAGLSRLLRLAAGPEDPIGHAVAVAR
ncbi:MAG: TrkA family potassium uptake protein [Hamadaea sp.]|nr:TrkA family potassium uptake protein [Hamadaea sp.]